MIVATWGRLATHLRRPVARMAAVGLVSAVAGVAEALTLVLVVRAALLIGGDGLADAAPAPLLGDDASTTALLVVAAALAVAGVVLHYLSARLAAGTGSSVLASVRDATVDAFAAAPWARQSEEREGALQESVSALATQSSNLAMAYATGLAATLHLAALLGAAALVEPLATIAVLGLGGAVLLALRPVARLTRRRSRRAVTANTAFAEATAATAALALEHRVFGVGGTAASRLRDAGRAAAEHQRRARVVHRFGTSLYGDLALLVLIAAVAALDGASDTAIAGIGTVAVLVVRSIGSAQRVQTVVQQISADGPALELLDARIRQLRAAAERGGDAPVPRIGRLVLEGVAVSYRPGERALTDVDLVLEPGDALGVVGPSGAGKSTLAQVLLRLRTPTEGRMTVDGVDARELADDDWFRRVAMVPQTPRLMAGTVADNIRFLRPGISDEAVARAADAAHVGDEIRGLERGFATVLGPRGSGLSGGQAQRVAFARALVGDPELLVLDEPTSGLDAASEAAIRRTIAELRGRITLVIVAHRWTTLDSCDRILALDGGRIVALGPPAELLEPGGVATAAVADDA